MDVLSWILRHASRKAWTAMNSGIDCDSHRHGRHGLPIRSKPIPGRSSCSISGVRGTFSSPQYRVAQTIILQTQKQLHIRLSTRRIRQGWNRPGGYRPCIRPFSTGKNKCRAKMLISLGRSPRAIVGCRAMSTSLTIKGFGQRAYQT
jgi:hypothetical protein